MNSTVELHLRILLPLKPPKTINMKIFPAYIQSRCTGRVRFPQDAGLHHIWDHDWLQTHFVVKHIILHSDTQTN